VESSDDEGSERAAWEEGEDHANLHMQWTWTELKR
jgi:hypothetical protein